jgi:hypothetical protein
MPGDLKNEAAVPTFIDELVRRETSHRQSAQDERSRAEAQALLSLLTIRADELNSIRLAEPIFGYDQVAV